MATACSGSDQSGAGLEQLQDYMVTVRAQGWARGQAAGQQCQQLGRGQQAGLGSLCTRAAVGHRVGSWGLCAAGIHNPNPSLCHHSCATSCHHRRSSSLPCCSASTGWARRCRNTALSSCASTGTAGSSSSWVSVCSPSMSPWHPGDVCAPLGDLVLVLDVLQGMSGPRSLLGEDGTNLLPAASRAGIAPRCCSPGLQYL